MSANDSYPLAFNYSTLRPVDSTHVQSRRLLRGPRRVVRLCVFAMLLPAVLITVPLYVRLVLYPPAHLPMMPTDQRLLARHVSSVWCQSQWTHMNGSYNAYLMPGPPTTTPGRTTYHKLHSLTLQDDVKEYWGLHLLRGSTITISACSSTHGAELLFLRGVANLHRCAWIGERDSLEEDGGAPPPTPPPPPITRPRLTAPPPPSYTTPPLPSAAMPGVKDKNVPEEQHDPTQHNTATGPGAPHAHNTVPRPNVTHNPKKTNTQNTTQSSRELFSEQTSITPSLSPAQASQERRDYLQSLLRTVIKVSKDKKEILRTLHMLSRGDKRPLPKHLRVMMGIEEEEEEDTPTDRLRRALAASDEEDGAFEEVDDIFENVIGEMGAEKNGKADGVPGVPIEGMIGGRVFQPEGLRFERGKFNQTNRRDRSDEEVQSSYSSSEELRDNCPGVIMSLPLAFYRGCSFRWTDRNRVVYDIPVTGTYYFVFSSDNEIEENHIYFNLTVERVQYNVSHTQRLCTNTTECMLPLAFGSRQQAIVEVPETGDWVGAYVLDTSCHPRIPIFLTFFILAPLLILCCAFQ